MNAIGDPKFGKFIEKDYEKLTKKFEDIGIHILSFEAAENVMEENNNISVIRLVFSNIPHTDNNIIEEKYILAIMRVINYFHKRETNKDKEEIILNKNIPSIMVTPTTEAINIKDKDENLDFHSIRVEMGDYDAMITLKLEDYRSMFVKKEYFYIGDTDVFVTKCHNYIAIRTLMNKIYDEIIKTIEEELE